MSFSLDEGYVPVDFDSTIDVIRQGINAQFNTNFTPESFVGTGWYKYTYAVAQKIQEGEIKTSEVFQKLQQYFALTNERIQRPSVSYPGLLDSFTSEGYLISVKKPIEADAGKIFICVDVDNTLPDYPATRLDICTLISQYVVGGVVSMGTEVESITLTNGQSFDFKFNLPVEIPIKLRITFKRSYNSVLSIPSDETIRTALFSNIGARYRLGYNFEPQRYYTLSDALWASEIKLEWSDDDGLTWNDTIYEAEYTEVFTFELEDIEVVINS